MSGKIKRVAIAGASGPYENACQTMLDRFLKWADDRSFNELYPLLQGERKLRKDAEDELSKLVGDIAPSGAMWVATLGHFSFIMEKGYEAWIRSGRERNKIIEWNPEDPIHFESSEAAFEAGRRIGEAMKRGRK